MKRSISLSIAGSLTVLLLGAAAAQSDAKRDEDPSVVDRFVRLEDFEGQRTDEDKWRLKHQPAPGVGGFLTTSRLEAPPLAESRDYLSISYTGAWNNGVRIYPPHAMEIKGFVREIRVWVFGFGADDELYIDIRDREEVFHRVPLGRLGFQGWRELVFRPERHMSQRPSRLVGKNAGLQFLGFFLRPRHREQPGLVRLYLDELRAVTRDYFRKPTVNWKEFRR